MEKLRVAIIDYGMGNIRSVYNAIKHLGGDPVVAESPEEAWGERMIIPGVGRFRDGMRNLRRFIPKIEKHVNSGMPLLGICLGLQMLFERSEEDLGEKGLGTMKGTVVKIETEFKLPHIGWNSIKFVKRNCPLFRDLEEGYAYFVHSYHAEPREDVIAATADYGSQVTAAVWKGNIFGTQFHPERSATLGLNILKNFLEL